MNEPAQKLPVWATSVMAWRLVGINAPVLLRTGWGPAILILATDFLLMPMLPFAEESLTGTLSNTLLQVLPTALLLVPVHRMILLDEEPPTDIAALHAGTAHAKFIKRTLMLDAVAFALYPIFELSAYVLGPLAIIAVLGLGLPATYAIARLSLMLPASAIDQDAAIRRAWEITDGNGWRILGTMIVTAIPLLVIVFGIIGFTGDDLPFAWKALLSIASVFGSVVGAVALSLCYRILVTDEPAGCQAPKASP